MADTSQNLDNSAKESSLNPPVTMKVEAPAEDKTESEDNKKNESSESEQLKVCSPSNRIPVTASNPFASSQNKFVTRGILKPPQLSLNNSTNSPKPSFVLNPSRLNPFARSSSSDSSKEEAKSSQVNGETPKFVPLIQTETKNNTPVVTVTTSSTVVSTSSFIFGQNLQERVVASENKSEEPKPSTSVNSNGTTEMLFSSAIKNETKSEVGTNSTKSLSESAREYEESRAVKRKYEEVEVITGEEGETNILNITCKLFAFDKATGSWQERGRGVLRLNDFEVEQNTHSRLVFRTTGSLRVVLNTKIWAEMTVEQASGKSVRFTALDANGVIRVFLVMASIEESKQLYSQLQMRVQKEVASQKHKKTNVDTDSGGN